MKVGEESHMTEEYMIRYVELVFAFGIGNGVSGRTITVARSVVSKRIWKGDGVKDGYTDLFTAVGGTNYQLQC